MSALTLNENNCDEIRVGAPPILEFRAYWTPKECEPSLFGSVRLQTSSALEGRYALGSIDRPGTVGRHNKSAAEELFLFHSARSAQLKCCQ
jgi:hypothetical protein